MMNSLKTEGNGPVSQLNPFPLTSVKQQARKQGMAYGLMSADHRAAKKTDRCRHQDPGPGFYGAGWDVLNLPQRGGFPSSRDAFLHGRTRKWSPHIPLSEEELP